MSNNKPMIKILERANFYKGAATMLTILMVLLLGYFLTTSPQERGLETPKDYTVYERMGADIASNEYLNWGFSLDTHKQGFNDGSIAATAFILENMEIKPADNGKDYIVTIMSEEFVYKL